MNQSSLQVAEPAVYAVADLAFARATVLMQCRMTDAISASKLLQLATALTRAAAVAAASNDADMASLFLQGADVVNEYVVSL